MISNARPKTITVIIAMLLLLAVVSVAATLTTQLRFGNVGRQGAAGFNGPRQGTGTGNNGFGAGQADNGTANGGTGQGNNGFNSGQRRSAPGGFNLFSITRSLGLSPQVMIYFNIGLPIVGIALLLASAYGVWKVKRWGLNLAIVLGLLFLAGAVPGFFNIGGRNINWLRVGLNALSAVATLPILALSFLPSVHDYFPKPARKPKTR
jgi:hypothetical protein